MPRAIRRTQPGGHTVSLRDHPVAVGGHHAGGRRGRTLKHTSIEHIGKGGIVTHRFGHAGESDYGMGSHEKKHVFTDRKALMSHLVDTLGVGDPADAEAGGEGGASEGTADE